ncbi:MAG TPA: PaaI family thioesterase [Stellaceae bacterium]|nr:PaaI family thioesterase [Stellaceae bacterium]
MSVKVFKDGITVENLKTLLDMTPFAAFLRPEIIKCEDGYAELHVAMRRELTQHHGYAHGAVIGCIADSACAWAAGSVAGDVVTAEYKINLLAPAVGDKLIGRGYVLKSGRSMVVARSEVFAAKGERERLVAAALATIAVLQ